VEKKLGARRSKVGGPVPQKTELALVCTHPLISVVLGDVGDPGEPYGIPVERMIFDDVPEAARGSHPE
jgi:hypothetical protein